MSQGRSAQERLAASLSTPFAAPGENTPEKSDPPRPKPATRPTVRTKDVRRTVDLPVARHHKLNEWCEEQAVQLGVARVPGQYVLAELVALLLTDVRTQQMITEAVRKRFEEQ